MPKKNPKTIAPRSPRTAPGLRKTSRRGDATATPKPGVVVTMSADRASATIWLDPAATKAGAITATAARRAGAK